MKNLLLTLGHNSSAILIDNDEIVWGYETERISGLKSDSRYPQEVLNAKGLGGPLAGKIDMAYITHWAPDGRLSSMSQKHWQPENFEGVPILSLSPDITHHDTHMYAAMAYAGRDFKYGYGTYGLMIDGFGTYGEHISIYRLEHYQKPKLIKRYHGYGTSLGLWFQYATAFMGMKMHEDEYKILGYEPHVHRDDAYLLDTMIERQATEWMEELDQSIYGSKFDPMYNLSALDEIRHRVFQRLAAVCQEFNLPNPHSRQARAILSYYVQGVLESVVLKLMVPYNAVNLLCAGGVFYNVKLNHLLHTTIAGNICIYPLAGDQGNAIGLYAAFNPQFEFPKNLFWGKRQLKHVGEVRNLRYATTSYEASQIMDDLLAKHAMVNLVRGHMEFGPRSLCNTSTIAIPDPKVVAAINEMNNRNTVMPMAPVMSKQTYHETFQHPDTVWKSHEHMVIAMEYLSDPDGIEGVAHEYFYPQHCYTGRPQVLNAFDPVMSPLLSKYGVLINTSFNFHGVPIAYDMESVIKNHMLQLERNPNIHTVVITNA